MAKMTVINSHSSAKRQLRVAAYCRVSTGSEEQLGSLEQQVAAYRHMIASNRDWIDAGIFAEAASGLNVKERLSFRDLLRKCQRGKVDLILVKSISRFGRNTLEMIRALRKLNDLGVDVYFETENLYLQGKELRLVIELYCAFAQWESEEKSHSIKWGVQQGFSSGTSGYAGFTCYGYRRGAKGELLIYEPEAAIVRNIFSLRISGISLGQISDVLYDVGLPSPTGKQRWSRETINKLLHNEKYVGDVLLQKTYVPDLFAAKQVKNCGQQAMFLIENHHPAIVEREIFEQVREMPKSK